MQAYFLAANVGKYVVYNGGKAVISAVVGQASRQAAVQATKEIVKTELGQIAPSATSFIGKRGWELKNTLYQPLRNNASLINGRKYSGHVLDQMQNRGIMPSIVENTLKNGKTFAGKNPLTTVHYDELNNVTVICNEANGKIITTSFGLIRQ